MVVSGSEDSFKDVTPPQRGLESPALPKRSGTGSGDAVNTAQAQTQNGNVASHDSPMLMLWFFIVCAAAWLFFNWMLKRKKIRVAEESARMKSEAEPDTTTTKQCAACGLVNPDSAKFCLECGASQNREVEAENVLPSSA
jgi:hypothetical protein